MTQSVKMHGAVVIIYLFGFMIYKTDGSMTLKTRPKIIGGQPVDIKHRPFMLSLHNAREFLCGASILSRRWGITALHCLIPTWLSTYYVRAGSNKTNKGGSVHRITNIHIYNGTYVSWFSRMLHHDIALFEVRPYFRFSRTVQPIYLPKLTNETQPELLFVSGWGYTNIEKEGKTAETLMNVYIRYVPFETCIKAAPEYSKFVKDDYHICYGTQGKDSCYGDSGGALATKKIIYGIVSFGHRCGEVPGVYMKVSYYQRWIKNVTNL